MNDEKKTQREVADIAGITEVTIRNRYKELIEKLKLEDKIKQKEKESKKSRYLRTNLWKRPCRNCSSGIICRSTNER
jgi:hypothetical protein